MAEYLYDNIASEFGRRTIEGVEIPRFVRDNLRKDFRLREYQMEALKRFLLFYNDDFYGRQPKPWHLLFNMATGSGKTLVMAALMLYLYKEGYRNFLFFVNSTTVIRKTKANFLDSHSSKYLFADIVRIDGKEVRIKEVQSFDEADGENINIKFETTQGMDSEVFKLTKENGLSLEDLREHRIALIGDEAHHNNRDVWGGEIEQIHHLRADNILLEFTATTDYADPEIAEKYKNKVIYRYDLRSFRKDLFTKEINLFHCGAEIETRLLNAMVLNLYRQELANSHGISLKPVALYKSRTIKESNRNEQTFHELVRHLTPQRLEEYRREAGADIIQEAFRYLEGKGLDAYQTVSRIRHYFREENCLNANNDTEVEVNQMLLNSLEDSTNPIRAIFAVDKLNEGWDVLNLFDIVRLYDTRDANTKTGKVGKTTIQEAQLIGRGARYFPFTVGGHEERYRRKFDNEPHHELRILEELYYHAGSEPRYISEIKKALQEMGSVDEEEKVELRLELKESFKQTNLYKNGYVVFNRRREKDRSTVHSFADMRVSKTDVVYALSSQDWSVTNAFTDVERKRVYAKDVREVPVGDIPRHLIHYELSRKPFFRFDRQRHYFPSLRSMSEYVESAAFLGGLCIRFEGTAEQLADIPIRAYRKAVEKLLGQIEAEMLANDQEYEGTDFNCYERVRDAFTDKTLMLSLPIDEKRRGGQKAFLSDKDWYAYNANYGTSEERRFVEMFAARFEALSKRFEDIYLMRNELFVSIYDKDGRRFEPDFILFCRQREGETLMYQVFIEPKGAHLMEKDRWKAELLERLRKERNTYQFSTDRYVITGVPFYNYASENDFKTALGEALR